MKIKLNKFIALMLLAVILSLSLTNGETVMADTIIYRAHLASNKNRVAVVKQNGKKLIILLQGFGNKEIELAANGGGVSTCRTIIEHNSAEANVILSLPMPDPRATCRMLPASVSIESQTHNISIDEENIKKLAGTNSTVRSAVQKSLGKIQEGES